MNNFIASGKGFLKSTEFNKETLRADIVWTKLLREAQKFNKKGAITVINKYDLDAFIWNPYAEEPIRGKWEVLKRRENYSFIHDENHEALEWEAKRVAMEKKTDLNFLLSKGVEKTGYYDSEEEAIEVTTERNKKIIEELHVKIQKMQKVYKN